VVVALTTSKQEAQGANKEGFLFLYVVRLYVLVRSLNDFFLQKNTYSYVTIAVFT